MIQLFTKKRRKGFTLIELIVVIAILGILAAIAIPRFMSQTDNAKDAAREATTRTLNSAAAMYMADEDASDTVAGSGNELSAATTAAGAYASLVAADLIQPLDADTQTLFDSATAPKITYDKTDKLFTYTK